MYQKIFSHIYVEEEAFQYETTIHIMKKFPSAKIIKIKHYKDVFCRKHQDFRAQKRTPVLILAVNQEKNVYKGARVCQDFGNEHFYYCSNIKNCIYDCEYCYLQGMYPSANIVIFVNLENIFMEVDMLLKEHPVYLCISYDTDLLALDRITGFLKKWADYASNRNNLTIEVRTKSGILVKEPVEISNFIFAWTMSPELMIKKYEAGTASLDNRIKAANHVIKRGGKIHLCFDPIIYCDDFERIYGDMFQKIFGNIDTAKVDGVSLGTFRISKSYMKNMRKQHLSTVTAFPYQCINGVYQYEKEMNKKILEFSLEKIRKYIEDSKIFVSK